MNKKRAGQGVGNDRTGDGGTSKCVCPECGLTVNHIRNSPCSLTSCPKCKTKMVGKSND